MPALIYTQELQDQAQKLLDAGYSHSEIAAKLNIKRGSVCWLLARSLKSQRPKMTDEVKKLAMSLPWR